MQHYWGGKAIAARVGCHPRSLYTLKRKYGLPGFLRVDPRNHFRRILYASEAMILAWELAMSRTYNEQLLASQTVPDPVTTTRPSSAEIIRRMNASAETAPDHGSLAAEASSESA